MGLPAFALEQLESSREATCVVCEKTACRAEDGWYADTVVQNNGDGPYLEGDGEYFPDADDTPHGWVCSKGCRSDAMFNHASDAEKKALRRVRDACHVLDQYGREALALVEKGMEDSVSDLLPRIAVSFLRAIAADEAQWCNEESREDALESAIRSALLRLDNMEAPATRLRAALEEV